MTDAQLFISVGVPVLVLIVGFMRNGLFTTGSLLCAMRC